ncbi:MAG: hypothetical protein DRP74_03345 [Candidatus Omnitrophota bacterium]|nr:MAG: hypothetical protein DRP74_03345 [Candidatus Omnitrophota bacterium]
MLLKIKKRVDREIKSYINNINRLHSLSKISPVLFKTIKNFISRKGKRIRPILFIIAYLGFVKKAASGLYRSAISAELLHDFMLAHDDIIDKSETRRGSPSMHTVLNRYLSGHKNIKFNGQDLAIVVGDVMFAMAMHAFLSINEEKQRKEDALRRLLDAALYTGSGEFIELLNGIKNINKVTRKDIYRIYDLKTANYSFASPLAIGSTLAGANKDKVNRLFKYGVYLGRAFQVKDDILGLFAEDKITGKSNLTDLKEGKKTLLIWYAYQHAGQKEKALIKKTLSKRKVNNKDLSQIQKIVVNTGSLDYARKEINNLIQKAKKLNALLGMRPQYKKFLLNYSQEVLN